ncbi:hypothetical protein ACHAQH_008462 [Verticillium albo-atrum]
MGSCFSTPEALDSVQVEKSEIQRLPQTLSIPEAKWELNESWTQSISFLHKSAIESGNEAEFQSAYPTIFFRLVRDWLDEANPACAQAGSIEDMGESSFNTSDGPCRYPTKTSLTLDDHFTGVVVSTAMAVALPLKKGGLDPVTPGSTMNTPEVGAAKKSILMTTAYMRQSGVNFKHAVVQIFAGSDLYSWRFDAENLEPTISRLPWKLPDSFKAKNKAMVRAARKVPEAFRGTFLPMMFQGMVIRRRTESPGCTVWDEGELPFKVNGKLYPNPTRMLAARLFDPTTQELDNVAQFRVITPVTEPTDCTETILRNRNPEKDPGDIVAITLVVATDPSVIWPTLGTYAKSATLKAAEEALLNHVKKLNREGKVHRCVVHVILGVDESKFKFIGEHFDKSPSKGQDSDSNTVTSEQPAVAATSSQPEDSSLSAFNVRLTELPKHQLFESEGQFQAIKQYMEERFRENPEVFKAMESQVATTSAMHMLKLNFPACDISDEGDFPAADVSTELPGTKLIVARDPKQEPKSVVAAVHVVPRLPSEVTWLGTPEMQGAEESLLSLLKRWHAEGRISEVDCMAQVMMGTDASVYQFVDGQKFVDYSDDRMARFTWG